MDNFITVIYKTANTDQHKTVTTTKRKNQKNEDH